MSFFHELTFARVMIMLCLVGSGVGSYFVYQNFKKIETTHRRLEDGGEIERLVEEIQILSKEYTELAKKAKDEGLSGKKDPLTYIDRIATGPMVEVGRVDIDISTKEFGKNYVDNIFTIKPFLKDISYQRTNIANFLYTLEEKSRRVRVTELKIEALDSAGKPMRRHHELPSDQWRFSCKVTSRQRRE